MEDKMSVTVLINELAEEDPYIPQTNMPVLKSILYP